MKALKEFWQQYGDPIGAFVLLLVIAALAGGTLYLKGG